MSLPKSGFLFATLQSEAFVADSQGSMLMVELYLPAPGDTGWMLVRLGNVLHSRAKAEKVRC
jgi:hypothetical protein